jgi:predicted dehydrogenase
MRSSPLTRRQVLGRSALAAATVSIVPRHVLGQGARAPSDKLNLAVIGVGGRGWDNFNEVGGQNRIALCDTSAQSLDRAAQAASGAKTYRDFRKLLDENAKRLDGVIVATPDHTHAVAAIAAIKRGLPVYCEKPLAHSVYEVRELVKAARERKVPTQLGNQGHSFDTIRSFCEWVWDGAIGRVHTVHAGCQSVYSAIGSHRNVKDKHDVPPHLDWDLWIGPAAMRPYNPMYQPGSWRSWSPFGTGVIGDWICHVVDPVFWALELGAPATVQAEAQGYDPKEHADTYGKGHKVTYKFAAKGPRGPVTLVWHDGEIRIPRPPELADDKGFPGIGAVVLGEKGGIVYGSHGAGGLRLFPEALAKGYKMPPRKLPRPNGHHGDWLKAIKDRTHVPGSSFEYGGALTELALLGNIAYRFLGLELKWDGPGMKFTNCAEANALLKPSFRQGWTL